MEKRRHPRFPVEIPVRCEFGDHARQFRVVNISRFGMLVKGIELPQVGTLVTMRFSLAGSEETEMTAVVRHHVHGGEVEFIGVEFIEVLQEQQMQLIDYLDRLAT